MWKAVMSMLAIVATSACGGGGGGAPTTPSPSLASLSLAPATDLIKVKGAETFTANASFSDGSSRVVEATWGSDNTAVATVSAGRATGVAAGQATIFADYQGQRATRLLRVVPDYHGRWSGDHRQTSCAGEGDWREACEDFPNGDLYMMTLALTQTRDALTGTADFGEPGGTVRGSIRMTGHLGLEGSQVVTDQGLTLELTLANWETLTTDNERMTGRFSLIFRGTGLDGSLRLDCELRIVSKTSATPLAAVGRGSHNVLGQRLLAALRAARARKNR